MSSLLAPAIRKTAARSPAMIHRAMFIITSFIEEYSHLLHASIIPARSLPPTRAALRVGKRSVKDIRFSGLIHPSDPWPLAGHTEAMKMEPPPRLFSLREYGWRLTSGRSDPYFHGPTRRVPCAGDSSAGPGASPPPDRRDGRDFIEACAFR